jgi:hypothetical protein
MLATADRREIDDALDGPMEKPACRRFSAAYRELCTRIWIELELLTQAARQHQISPLRDLDICMATLRLELVLLVDFCRSVQGRSLLSVEQSERMCSMLTDVLAALYVDMQDLRAGLEEAQDRVLDELTPESVAWPAPVDVSKSSDPYRNGDPAIDELLTLVEQQAAARAYR